MAALQSESASHTFQQSSLVDRRYRILPVYASEENKWVFGSQVPQAAAIHKLQALEHERILRYKNTSDTTGVSVVCHQVKG